MERIVRWSGWIYGYLLIAYPRELRRRFGANMVEVFEDQLYEAGVQRGRLGIVSLWRTALWELASVAIPSRLESTTVIAGTVSFLVSSAIAWIFFRSVG
jgi:hypothetical protein